MMPIELRLRQRDWRAECQLHGFDLHATHFAVLAGEPIIWAGILCQYKGVCVLVYCTCDAVDAEPGDQLLQTVGECSAMHLLGILFSQTRTDALQQLLQHLWSGGV